MTASPVAWLPLSRSKAAMPWLVFVVAALIILVARWFVIARYGSSLPYWDQWGDEAGLLYRSWVSEHFDWRLLWRAHNEHRIFVSRVWALLLFSGNQEQWDPMVQAMANSAFIALSLAAAIAWCYRRFSRWEFLPVAVGIVAIAILPSGWGNTLVGFQSCFHFALVFSLLAIIRVATARAGTATIVIVVLASILALLSLAVGLLTVPVIAFVLAIRLYTGSLSALDVTKMSAPLVLIFLVGLYFMPDVQGLGAAKPSNAAVFLQAFAIAASWPFAAPLGVLMWLPLVAWCCRTAKTRTASLPDVAVAGVAAWALLICVGIAYSRGQQLVLIESRYTDLVAFAAVANAYFVVRCFNLSWPELRPVAKVLLASVVSAALLYGLEAKSRSYLDEMREWSGRTQVAASNVSRFLRGDEQALKGKPQQYIPVPAASEEELASLLRAPAIRQFLPFTLLDPVESQTIDRSRVCHWLFDDEVRDAAWGRNLSCGITQGQAPTIPVGPLSALVYSARSLINTDWMSVLVPTDATMPKGTVLRCSLETVNDEPSAVADFAAAYSAAIKLSGWIGPRSDKPIRLWLTAENGIRFETSFRSVIPRPDVAAYLKEDGFAGSGYGVWIDGSALAAGRYRVSVDMADTGGCETHRAVVVGARPDRRLAY